MNEAVWYFDPISPFAYLALPAVESLAGTTPITCRPIVFAALLAHAGQLGPAEIPAKRLHTYRLCQFLADQAGLPFRFPPAHPFRSLDALRLLTALGPSLAQARTAFQFVWQDGRDPAAEHAALAASLGIPDPDALIERTGAKALLRTATDQAIAAGVFGVPTLAIGSALFWGADAMPMARAYLERPGLFDTPDMARLDTLPAAASRTR